MRQFQADFHIHVGMSESGRWIKIPTSAKLTVRNILEEAAYKGIDFLGIIDALSPLVQSDLACLEAEGLLTPLAAGGYIYQGKKNPVYLILGAEVETTEVGGGVCHTLLYLPDRMAIAALTKHLSAFIKNVNMSSQNAHMTLGQLVDLASEHEAIIVPAHIFTPFKSLYGATASRMEKILTDTQRSKIAGAEIGLSADSLLADCIGELADFTLLSNSDAHSLDRIGRESNTILLAEPSFSEYKKLLLRHDGRRILKNYGLDPRLGKYHKTHCLDCGNHETFISLAANKFACGCCQSLKVVRGVFDRIQQIADYSKPRHPDHRPPYHYQLPLNFLPGIGAKTAKKLRDSFVSEFYILHEASYEELSSVVKDKVATIILGARDGSLAINAGGGGFYGKVISDS
ncbi:MAG: endonuclease Q family protein [Sporomusaceae bacterium]|nr:endonuclease Q family protein [Sporomusaceae bacterium]